MLSVGHFSDNNNKKRCPPERDHQSSSNFSQIAQDVKFSNLTSQTQKQIKLDYGVLLSLMHLLKTRGD